MATAMDTVLYSENLLFEIFSFLDASSLGRIEQVHSGFQEASLSAWKVHAQSVRGHLSIRQEVVDAVPHKEQVRRHCLARNLSRRMTCEHRRHYLQATTYIWPRSEPEVSPRCSYCTSFPNFRTSLLLSKSVHSHAFFVQMSILSRTDESGLPKTILESFLPIQRIDATGKYATLRLSLQEAFDPAQWPSLSLFLEGSRQRPEDRQHTALPIFANQLLAKLEVTVTAINLSTSQPSLLVATAGGKATSADPLTWRMFRRMADCHPNPAALGFGVIPSIDSTITLLPDFSNFDSLELRIV